MEEEVNCTWTIQVGKKKKNLMKNIQCNGHLMTKNIHHLKTYSVTLKTEKNLYLLVTFHNLSAPFTVDCEGAYIEVAFL